ncbi:MAG: hypothetical protein HDKAJFGB_00295 [Anaerolineae bacterium]|nr:hypothetical protein [Anaerolineae bacterium]
MPHSINDLRVNYQRGAVVVGNPARVIKTMDMIEEYQ